MERQLDLLLDLLTSDKSINDLLESLLAHTHVFNQLSLHLSVILWNICVKSFDSTSTNTDHDRLELVLESNFAGAHQVAQLADMDHWNGYFHTFDHLLDLLVKLISSSRLKDNGCFSEQIIAILFN